MPAGAYTVVAVAYDTLGAWTSSNPAQITVSNGTITGITASTPRRQGDNIIFTVTGTNPCGLIRFDFGDGSVYSAAAAGLPHNEGHTYTGGWKTITASGDANCTGTASMQIYVDAKPTATLTSPAHGATYLAPGVVPVRVTAADDIAVNRVEFWLNGGHSMAQTTTSTFTVNNPGPSMVTGVYVNPSPVGVGQPATIYVEGTNPCGAVQVNFGDGSPVQVYPMPTGTLPWSIGHTFTTSGQKTVTAIGHGNCSGNVSTTVTVQ